MTEVKERKNGWRGNGHSRSGWAYRLLNVVAGSVVAFQSFYRGHMALSNWAGELEYCRSHLDRKDPSTTAVSVYIVSSGRVS